MTYPEGNLGVAPVAWKRYNHLMTQYNGTRKDYAASLGLAKRGKGRMNREATEAVNKAIAEGMTFSDHRVGVTKGSEPSTGPVVVKADTDDAHNYSDAYYRYELDQQFSYNVDGKVFRIGSRGACMTCGYSLVGHVCDNPVVLTYHGAQSVRPIGE